MRMPVAGPPTTAVPQGRGGPTITLIAAALGFFTTTLDTTIVNVALPTIGRDLGGGVSALQWVVDGYTLAFAALLLSTGALSDRFGASRCFAVGVTTFTAASAACGLAPDMAVILIARVVQGAGAALILPSSLALIQQAYGDNAKRARAVALWTAAGGVAVAAGPVLGGLLTTGLGWRSVFFVNVPIGVFALLALTRSPRAVPRPAVFDLAGQLTAVAALALLVFAVTEAGEGGLAQPLPMASLLLFVVAAAAFLYVEHRGRHPMVPLTLFHSRSMSLTTAIGLTINMAFYGMVFVLSLYFQQILGKSVLVTGLMFVPMAVLISVSNLTGARLSRRYGPRLPIVLGQLLQMVGLAALLFVDTGTSTPLLLLLLVPLGVGSGLIIPPLTSALLEASPPELAGTASGVLSASRQVGGALGVAVFGALVAHHATFLSGLHKDAVIGIVCLAVTAAGALLLPGRTASRATTDREAPAR